MSSESPIADAAPGLIAAAAAGPTWRLVLRHFGLCPTEANIAAFLDRARALEVDVSHLRHRRDFASLSDEELERALWQAKTLADVCEALGLSVGGETYTRVRAVYAGRGISLDRVDRKPSPRGRRAAARFSVSDDELRAAFVLSRSTADLLRRVGLVAKGDNYRVVRLRLAELGLDVSQLSGKGWAGGQRRERLPLEAMLTVGSSVSGTHLKSRLLDEGLMVAACSACGLREWRGQPVSLELDHVNGDSRDNRLDNLRLLCPNCHAQTPTYRGRNKGRRRRTLAR